MPSFVTLTRAARTGTFGSDQPEEPVLVNLDAVQYAIFHAEKGSLLLFDLDNHIHVTETLEEIAALAGGR